MNNVKLSIVTVSYNSYMTIARTIDSVVGQSYRNIEYCIVDGNSKDGTVDIIKKYHSLYPDIIKYVSEPDKGIYDAMNKGIKMSTGQIIGIVNSDDWLEPDSLQIVSETFEKNGSNLHALYCGGISLHKLDGNVERWDANIKSFKRQAPLYVMSGIRHPATFVPRQVYEKIGLFNNRMKLSADQDFILRCYFNGIEFVEIKNVLSNMSEGGISTSESDKARLISQEDRKIMLDNFGKRGVSYYFLYYTWLFRGWIRRCIKRII